MSADYTHLDKLTDQLYADLIRKSEKEIAAKEALSLEKIAAEKLKAEREVEAYRKKEEQEIAQERKRMESELSLKAEVVLDDLRLNLTKLLAAKMVTKPIEKLFTDEDFIKEYLFKLAEQISRSPLSLSLSLSADAQKKWQAQLNKHFPNLSIKLGADEHEIKILNDAEGFHFSIGEKELKNLFYSYLDQSLQARLKHE
tara:strand:- start:602 stop:1198 length:597 start_codon:yes stop_codon:yes gene_type:complete